MNRVVYDGGDMVYIPESMGSAKVGQMQGTVGERLCELACRICYDSLGTGRSSADLHAHILEVQNHSVYEHYNFTVQFNCSIDSELSLYRALANRKGTYIRTMSRGVVQITTNLRAILEWTKNFESVNIRRNLAYYGHQLCPQIIPRVVDSWDVRLVVDDEELCEDQIWISMYLDGSRALLNEQVRHRFAMSQRSTRYVDESNSDFIIHPLVVKYLDDMEVSKGDREYIETMINRSALADKLAYDAVVAVLQEYLIKQGVDKLGARKQARGAGRLHLPNGLWSEMIFSAPISGWKWILSQRYNDMADAEIRLLYADVYESLMNSRYGKYFEGQEIRDAKDGIGTVMLTN